MKKIFRLFIALGVIVMTANSCAVKKVGVNTGVTTPTDTTIILKEIPKPKIPDRGYVTHIRLRAERRDLHP